MHIFTRFDSADKNIKNNCLVSLKCVLKGISAHYPDFVEHCGITWSSFEQKVWEVKVHFSNYMIGAEGRKKRLVCVVQLCVWKYELLRWSHNLSLQYVKKFFFQSYEYLLRSHIFIFQSWMIVKYCEVFYIEWFIFNKTDVNCLL